MAHRQGENNVRARELFARATEIDPNYAFAWAMLGETHWMDLLMRLERHVGGARAPCLNSPEKAFALDDSLPEAHALMAHAHRVRGNSDKAIAAGKKGRRAWSQPCVWFMRTSLISWSSQEDPKTRLP